MDERDRYKPSANGFTLGDIERVHIDEDNRLTLSKDGPAYILKGFINGTHIMEAFRILAHARIHLEDHLQRANQPTDNDQQRARKDSTAMNEEPEQQPMEQWQKKDIQHSWETRDEYAVGHENGYWDAMGDASANAHDLLEAAKAVLPDLERYVRTHGPGPDRRLDALKPAIAKAEAA